MSHRPPLVSPPVPVLDLQKLNTTYSNYFRASGSADEVILDFGVDDRHHTANGPEPIQMLQRLALPWSNAQEVFDALQQLLRQRHQMHEGNNGANVNRPPNQST